ncbi:MAG: excinuclease ABC subunit UvrC [Phycisphaerales bacterium]|jgi:excinuclease ABC subunit C|nr:excinuclease ABC subunit UvrC [Phycisphaerales bacterium]
MAGTRQTVLNRLREEIAELPTGPGVYLFKDTADVVLYVGKAKSLRSRVASYFQPSADLLSTRGPEIRHMISELVTDISILECDSEVDALLRENRLIKDIQPRFNDRLKDGKTFPFLQVTTREDFPRVSITRQPQSRGVKLYGPFVSVKELRSAIPLMQRVFKFRTCKLDISADDDSRRRFRPCILHSIKQCSAPCADKISAEDYKLHISHFRKFLESKGTVLRRELTRQMKEFAEAHQFERAAELRDELKALEALQRRGLSSDDIQPEQFYVDPAEGLARLAKLLNMASEPRSIEGIDIAHLDGGELCGALVCFIDGKPFKNSYRRYKIQTVAGNDDFASIREVVWRRYKHAGMNAELFPDIILIDGGKGQLSAAHSAFDGMEFTPPVLLSLAKKEEMVFVYGREEPLKLPRRDPALRLLQSVRDESHRFVQHYHHILRRKATFD